jgi:hypothetical protein
MKSDPPAKIIELCTLTPHYQGPRGWRTNWEGVRILEAIDQESRIKGNDLRDVDTVAFVMHQPRLQQLLATMTSQDQSRFRSLTYSEGIRIKANSFDEFFQGKAVADGWFSHDARLT